MSSEPEGGAGGEDAGAQPGPVTLPPRPPAQPNPWARPVMIPPPPAPVPSAGALPPSATAPVIPAQPTSQPGQPAQVVPAAPPPVAEQPLQPGPMLPFPPPPPAISPDHEAYRTYGYTPTPAATLIPQAAPLPALAPPIAVPLPGSVAPEAVATPQKRPIEVAPLRRRKIQLRTSATVVLFAAGVIAGVLGVMRLELPAQAAAPADSFPALARSAVEPLPALAVVQN